MNNQENIRVIANALQEIVQEVVFVGGAVVEMYATHNAYAEVRPTDDVDCVVEITSRKDYYALEEKLRQKGFKNDQRPNAPICRWIYQGLIVDIMPIDENILGFSNRWYLSGFENAINHSFNEHESVKIFALSYFLASKMEAFQNRGKADYRTSKDFEDIVFVLDNCENVAEKLQNALPDVRQYIAKQCAQYIQDKNIREGISAVLEYGVSPKRIEKIENILTQISRLKTV